MQLNRYNIRIGKINHIMISHLHGDHFYGLIGLVMTYHLFGRENPLHIYGPYGIEEIINIQLKGSQTTLEYPLHFHIVNTEVSSLVYEDEHLEVLTIPMMHRIPTCGYLFREKPRERKMKPGIVNKLKIPVECIHLIKKGMDYTDASGKIYLNSELTLDPVQARCYAFCSDTAYQESISEIVKNSDLIYHEATFMHDRNELAQQKYHSTTVEAGTLALKAGARKLIIGHYSARYEDLQPLLDEARSIFPESYLAREGAVFNVGE